MSYKMSKIDNPENGIDKKFYNKEDGDSHWRAKVRELLNSPDYDDGVFFAFPKDGSDSTPPALVIGSKPQPPKQMDGFAQAIPVVYISKTIGSGLAFDKDVFDALSDEELSMVVQVMMTYMAIVANGFRDIFRNSLGDDYTDARQARLGRCSAGNAEKVFSRMYGESLGKFYNKISKEFDDFADDARHTHKMSKNNIERIKKIFEDRSDK